MWRVALWKRGNVPEVPVARIFSFKMGGVGFFRNVVNFYRSALSHKPDVLLMLPLVLMYSSCLSRFWRSRGRVETDRAANRSGEICLMTLPAAVVVWRQC